MISRCIAVLNEDEIDGPINNFIKKLINIRDLNSEYDYDNITVEISQDGVYSKLSVYGKVLETDSEYKNRMEVREKYRKKQEKKNREQYEALKKRFENE